MYLRLYYRFEKIYNSCAFLRCKDISTTINMLTRISDGLFQLLDIVQNSAWSKENYEINRICVVLSLDLLEYVNRDLSYYQSIRENKKYKYPYSKKRFNKNRLK